MSVRFIRILLSLSALLALLFVHPACVTIQMVSVDQKTQLENQILGSFEALQDDLILIASVRGEGQQRTDLSPAKREALMAMMNRQFNLDDVNDLRARGVAGEKRDGLLVFLETDRTRQDSAFAAFARRIIEEENRDRGIIMNRVIAMNPSLGPEDLPTVRRMMHTLALESAPAGTLVESPNGGWSPKTEARP